MYTFQKSVPFLVAVAISGYLGLELTCPPAENIIPCICDDSGDYIVVTCRHVPDSESFHLGIGGLRGYMVDELWIEDSDLSDIPGVLFNGTYIASITFLNSKIMTLGDKDNPPFNGLENILKKLTITDGFKTDKYPIPTNFQHLVRLVYLAFESNSIPKVGNDWFSSGFESLESLYINDCGLKDLENKVFSNLEKLTVLDLSENEIEYISRSMLPERAQHLCVIWLRNNKIKSLPADIFTSLPGLDRLYLANNELKQLPENTWKSMMTQLTVLYLNGNPLVCDVNIKWILNAKKPVNLEAKCKEPALLEGKRLNNLTEVDLK